MKIAAICVLFLTASVRAADFCSEPLIADVGASMRYTDDNSLWGYTNMTFTFFPQRGNLTGSCRMESISLNRDKIQAQKTYFMSASSSSSDDGLQCLCAGQRLTITKATCSFVIDFEKNRYPSAFQGSCIVNENKQRTVIYKQMDTSKNSLNALVQLDGPVQFHAMPLMSKEKK